MRRSSGSPSGFGIIEIILILAILGIIGLVGWTLWQVQGGAAIPGKINLL